MRANRYPTPEELLDELPERQKREPVEAALARAVPTAELLLGRPIKEREYWAEILENGQAVFLDAWPVTKISANRELLPDLGIIFASTSRDSLAFTYKAGFEEGDIPAYMKMLIKNIALWIVTNDDQVREQVAEQVRVGRALLVKEERQRDGYKAG